MVFWLKQRKAFCVLEQKKPTQKYLYFIFFVEFCKRLQEKATLGRFKPAHIIYTSENAFDI
jgi:hypothetical protein